MCDNIDLSCFSTAVLLPFAADFDELLIFPFFNGLSKAVGIALVFNSTFPTPKDFSSLLYG